jgi:Fic family protein
LSTESKAERERTLTVEDLRAEIDARPSDPTTARRYERARRDVIYDEIAASCAIAGAHLSPSATRRLIERGTTVGGTMADHLLTLGYARAAVAIARERVLRDPGQRYVTVAEIQRMHVTIASPLEVVRTPPAPPGAWRRANLPPVREGMVTVPHWLIEFEMSAFADRFGGGPRAGDLFGWLADAYERLERIRPFVEANGRIARLVVNLLLSRSGYPPATIAHAHVGAYQKALRAADAGDRAPLAAVFERGVRDNLERLAASLLDQESLRPLLDFAGKNGSLDALRKAAQRDRLRTIARGREVLTTQAWVDDYLARKSKAGRPTSQ